jgi:hypothetical protein
MGQIGKPSQSYSSTTTMLTVLFVALSALTLSHAIPQGIDFDLVLAAPKPTTVSQDIGAVSQIVSINTAALVAQATAVSSVTVSPNGVATGKVSSPKRDVEARAACAPQPAGAADAPAYSPDTASAFRAQGSFKSIATSAPVPSGYSKVFDGLSGSNNV